MEKQRRRLVAILFADIVKFCDLMVADEAACLRIRSVIARLVHQCADEYHGTVRNEAGDGFMLTFESAVDTLGAAIAIQRRMSGLALPRPDGSPVQLRIGIHSGDVVDEGDAFLGDAVNIAARVETMAKPGGICVTSEIEAQVRPVLHLSFTPVLRKPEKAFPRHVRVFDVGEGGLASERSHHGRFPRFTLLVAAGAAVAGLAILLWPDPSKEEGLPDPPYPAELYSPDDRPIILLEAPKEHSSVLGAVMGGGKVQVEEQRNDERGKRWLRISIKPGWMASHDLNDPDGQMIATNPGMDPRNLVGTVTYSGSDGLNVRESPNFAVEAYLTVFEGTKVRLPGLEQQTETHIWKQVEFPPSWIRLEGESGKSVVVHPLVKAP